MSKRITATAIGAALLMPSLAHGETSDEISAIRRELESMREAYEVRLRELEGRLEQAEARAREQDPATAPLVEAQQASPPPPQAGHPSTANSFNPAISVILQGSLNSYSQNPDDYALPGFQLGGDIGRFRLFYHVGGETGTVAPRLFRPVKGGVGAGDGVGQRLEAFDVVGRDEGVDVRQQCADALPDDVATLPAFGRKQHEVTAGDVEALGALRSP